jgi:hypothetical protein
MMDQQPVSEIPQGKINWRLVARGVLLALILILCAFGLMVSPIWAQHSLHYWLWMAPGFGVLSILLCSLYEHSHFSLLRWKVVQHQLLQWIGTTAAIYLVFRFIQQGFLKPEAAGPTATIIIALSVYLAGITFDWRLIVISLLLTAMAVGAIFLERAMLIVLGIILILGIAVLLLRPVIRNLRTSSPPPGEASGVSPHP